MIYDFKFISCQSINRNKSSVISLEIRYNRNESAVINKLANIKKLKS